MKLPLIVTELSKKITEKHVEKLLVEKIKVLIEHTPNESSLPEPLRDLYSIQEELPIFITTIEQRLIIILNYFVQNEGAYHEWEAMIYEVWQQVLQEKLSLELENESLLQLQRSVTDFPEPILGNILFFLPTRDIKSFALTSRKWKRVTDDELYWKEKIQRELTVTPILRKGQSYKEYYTDIYHGVYQKSHYSQSYKKYLQQYEILVDDQDDYLHFACCCGAEIWVANLIKNGADVVNDSIYAVKAAIDGANPAVLKVLLQAGANLNDPEDQQYGENLSALHYAILSNNYKAFMEIFLQKKDIITVVPALHLAAANGDHENIAKLLSTGVNVNEEDLCGCTALWWALMAEQENSVKVLIANRARLTNIAKWQQCTYYGLEAGKYCNSALITALMRKNYRCLSLLLNVRANVHEQLIGRYFPTRVSLLHVAAKHNFVEGLDLLVKHGLKVNDPSYPYSALHVAAKCGNLASVDWLLKNGAQVNQLGEWIILDEDYKDDSFHEYTPLFLAAENKEVNCMALLLEYGAKIIPSKEKQRHNNRSGVYDTILTRLILNAFIKNRYSAQSDEESYVEGLHLLLKHGANPNEEDGYDRYKHSSFEELLLTKHSEETLVKCASLLLEHNANPTQGYALHAAVKMKNIKMVKLLTESGKIDVSQQDAHSGDTPLMLATYSGLEIFRYLSEHGASFCETNKRGETVIEYANRAHDQAIIDFIQQQIANIPSHH